MAEYIDREAVKEIMQKYRCSDCTSEKSLDCPLCQLHKPFAEISKIPIADVEEVKRGKMNMYKPRSMNRNATYKCSVCGKLCSSYYNDVREWKFCPNCGAKMGSEGVRNGQRKTD